MDEFKIKLQGGIGDVFNVLSQWPLQSYYDQYGCVVYVTYGGPGTNDCGYGPKLKEFFFDRNPMFRWVEHSEFSVVPGDEIIFGKVFPRFSALQKSGYRVALSHAEKSQLAELDYYPLEIGFQLHNNSGQNKVWGLDRFDELANSILRVYPFAMIYLFDHPAVSTAGHLQYSHVKSLIGSFNFAQEIVFAQRMDLWVSVDSWVKYVARWRNRKQVILVQDVQYMGIEPAELLRGCFPTLLNAPEVRLLGVGYTAEKSVRIVSNVKDIPVSDVTLATLELLKLWGDYP